MIENAERSFSELAFPSEARAPLDLSRTRFPTPGNLDIFHVLACSRLPSCMDCAHHEQTTPCSLEQLEPLEGTVARWLLGQA